MATQTKSTKEIVDQIIAQFGEQIDSATLIDRVRGTLRVPPQKVSGTAIRIDDPVEAAAVNELVAHLAEVKRIRDTAAADYDAGKDVLKEYLEAAGKNAEGEDYDTIQVHNAVVFTWKAVTSWVLNQTVLKSRFPRQLPENADVWTERKTRTALLK